MNPIKALRNAELVLKGRKWCYFTPWRCDLSGVLREQTGVGRSIRRGLSDQRAHRPSPEGFWGCGPCALHGGHCQVEFGKRTLSEASRKRASVGSKSSRTNHRFIPDAEMERGLCGRAVVCSLISDLRDISFTWTAVGWPVGGTAVIQCKG